MQFGGRIKYNVSIIKNTWNRKNFLQFQIFDIQDTPP